MLLGGIQAKFDMVWLGWPGADFGDAEKDIVANEAMKQGQAMHRIPMNSLFCVHIVHLNVLEFKMTSMIFNVEML